MVVHVRTCAELIISRHECASLKNLKVLSRLNRYITKVQYLVILLQIVVTPYSTVEIKDKLWKNFLKLKEVFI